MAFKPTFKLTLKLDNLHDINQYDLVARLLATYHPQIDDENGRFLIEQEICSRLKGCEWNNDDPGTNELLERLDKVVKHNIVNKSVSLILHKPNIREIITSRVQTVTV